MRAGCRSGALSVRARHTPPGCRTRVRGVGCVYLVEPGWHRDGRCATRLRCAVRGVGFLRTSHGHHSGIIRASYGHHTDKESRHIRPRKRQGSGHHTDKESDITGHDFDFLDNRTRKINNRITPIRPNTKQPPPSGCAQLGRVYNPPTKKRRPDLGFHKVCTQSTASVFLAPFAISFPQILQLHLGTAIFQ